MMHGKRVFSVAEVPDAATLADKLANHSWCMCTGFKLGDVYYLNDSTGEDGICEFAVFRGGRQIESITFGWCDVAKALHYIEDCVSCPDPLKGAGMLLPRVQTPAEHGTCRYCR